MARSSKTSLAIIALLIASGVAAFAYGAGWFGPHRPPRERTVDALSRRDGNPVSQRVNRPKGISFIRELAAVLLHALVRHDSVFGRIAYVAHLLRLPSA